MKLTKSLTKSKRRKCHSKIRMKIIILLSSSIYIRTHRHTLSLLLLLFCVFITFFPRQHHTTAESSSSFFLLPHAVSFRRQPKRNSKKCCQVGPKSMCQRQIRIFTQIVGNHVFENSKNKQKLNKKFYGLWNCHITHAPNKKKMKNKQNDDSKEKLAENRKERIIRQATILEC